MATQRALPEVAPAEPRPLLFRLLGSTRSVFLLAILSTYVATVVLLVLGSIEMLETALAVVGVGQPLTAAQVRLHFIEAVDLFLIATILYVISVGLYQLADLRSRLLWWRPPSASSPLWSPGSGCGRP